MKRIHIESGIARSIFTLAACLLAGCDKGGMPPVLNDGRLTNQMAENAIGAASNAIPKVIGIQEIPQQNAAKVDLQISHLFFNVGVNWQKLDYSGPAQAMFIHYNDGKWILTDIYVPQYDRHLNVHVEATK